MFIGSILIFIKNYQLSFLLSKFFLSSLIYQINNGIQKASLLNAVS